MRRAAAGALAATVATLALGQAAPQKLPPLPALPATVDFPTADSSIWSMQRLGLLRKVAARRFALAPDDPETMKVIVEVRRIDDAVAGLRRMVAGEGQRVEEAAQILGEHYHRLMEDDARGHPTLVKELVAAIHARRVGLPRARAARIARNLLPLDGLLQGDNRSDYYDLLARFIDQYEGTEAALLASVDMLVGRTRDLGAQIEALDAFARAHAGTVAGAKALYQKGFQLHVNVAVTGMEPRNADPTERFMQVLAIVDDLESGAWPDCEWVDRAPELIINFYASDEAVYSPENLERVLDVYQSFVAHRFKIRDEAPTRYAIGYLITTRMADLYERQGDAVRGVERTFEVLEEQVTDVDAVRFLKAEFYLQRAQHDGPGREELRQNGIETLAELTRDGGEPYAAKALATLAALYFYERDYERAMPAYSTYLDLHPDSDWAWVAALRLGQSQEAVGDWQGAVATYRTAARGYATLAPAVVLANVFAARANETVGRLDEALRLYRRARDAWDHDFALEYTTFTRQDEEPGRGSAAPSAGLVSQRVLTDRIGVLEASMAFPDGALLEHGRRLLDLREWDAARERLEAFLAQHPDSPLTAEARYLVHRARFERALALADVETPAHDEAAAAAELEALAAEPWDYAVGAAGLARAALLAKAGATEQAKSLTRESLQRWLSHQESHRAAVPETALQAGVTAIRNLVLRPLGGPPYDNERMRWNAFDWPQQPPAFFIVNPDITVELPNGDVTTVTVDAPLPGFDNVLFMTPEHVRLLTGILRQLGGTRTREPRAIMETPNQPVGPSLDILALWKQFFPARPGHWSGWILHAYPAISRIAFIDEAHTRARAGVVIGYSGAMVVLEKQGEDWVAVRLTDFVIW